MTMGNERAMTSHGAMENSPRALDSQSPLGSSSACMKHGAHRAPVAGVFFPREAGFARKAAKPEGGVLDFGPSDQTLDLQ